MKNRRLWILIGCIFLVGAAFLLLDFRVAASNTQVSKLILTTDMGDNMPASMQRNDTINIALVGEGPMVGAMQKALIEKMNEAGMGNIELVQELEPASQNPILVVKVIKPDPIWTPFFAVSRNSIHTGYASNGDSTFMDAIEATRTSVGKKDVANMYAEFDVSDRSFGLISRPGYHQYLANNLAQEIAIILKDLYNR